MKIIRYKLSHIAKSFAIILLAWFVIVLLNQSTVITAQEVSSQEFPTLLGIYSPVFLGDHQTLTREVTQIEQWAGKRFSVVGSFIDLETHNPAYDIPVSLELLRTNGYTGWINLTSTRTMAEIAKGKADRGLTKIALAYANWSSQGKNRLAFIAPFPEMNGAWESYGEDPVNFKLAYQRVRDIFARAGVKSDAVRWVFAPNGWSPDKDRFEYYYPGRDSVDVVAFSGYNWGYCTNAAWKHWSQPQAVFQPYIQRFARLAPNKPIFIAQTASTSHTPAGSQPSVKDRWLQDTYTYLGNQPQVKGIIYFNIAKECDWQLFEPQGNKYSGYSQGISNPAFDYLSPQQIYQTKPELLVPKGEIDAA